MKTGKPMNPTLRNVIFITVAIAGGIVLFDPFGFFKTSSKPPTSSFSDSELTSATATFTKDAKKPADLIIQAFYTKQVLLVGELRWVKDEVDFISALLPYLHQNGINLLGMEHLRAADQADIDRLLSAATFDEKLAQDLLLRRMPLWGYQEYVDLLHAAWKINNARTKDEAPFQVIGISTSLNLDGIKNEDELKKPEVSAKVFANGSPDEFLAKTVLETLKAKASPALPKPRMLVFCERTTSLTRYDDMNYAKAMLGFNLKDQKRAGRIIGLALGSDAGTVLLHSPWLYDKSPIKVGYPANGLFDQVMTKLGTSIQDKLPLGFELSSSQFHGASISQSNFASNPAESGKNLVLGDLADIYIILKPIHEMKAVTPIPDFITAQNLPQVTKAMFKIDNAKIEDINKSIADRAQGIQRTLESFP